MRITLQACNKVSKSAKSPVLSIDASFSKNRTHVGFITPLVYIGSIIGTCDTRGICGIYLTFAFAPNKISLAASVMRTRNTRLNDCEFVQLTAQARHKQYYYPQLDFAA